MAKKKSGKRKSQNIRFVSKSMIQKAEKQMEKNKRLIEAGETFKGHKPSEFHR
jgi:hypothetical protein